MGLGRTPDLRITACTKAPVRAEGDFVLYWMVAFRRTTWSFSLQRAVEWARELGKPLVVLEDLRSGWPWDSARCHRFVLDGMRDNAARLRRAGVLHYPHVEPRVGAAQGLVEALSARACVVVTDDFPVREWQWLVASAARDLAVRVEKVDSNGLLPLRAADCVFPTAYAFRRFLQKNLRDHLGEFPDAGPLAGSRLPALAALPEEIERRWPRAEDALLAGSPAALGALPVDQSVGPVDTPGGPAAAQRALRRFLHERLERYAVERNQPEEEVTSGLSPYLHFGHVSAHQVFAELMELEGWSQGDLAPGASGGRQGWWGVSEAAEAFLDQLIAWRELGHNLTWQREDYDRYESLPDWAQATLDKHAPDLREYLYSLEDLEQSRTHDSLWNACQGQLVREGRLHNYLRMLWGKKIVEWSESPRQALQAMIELNNKWALDGRNPNSYSGILWCLGRYDRPWGPERPVFGRVRYMSSQNTARKVRVRGYIARFTS